MRLLLVLLAALALATPALAAKDDTYVAYLNGTNLADLGTIASLNSVPVTAVRRRRCCPTLHPHVPAAPRRWRLVLVQGAETACSCVQAVFGTAFFTITDFGSGKFGWTADIGGARRAAGASCSRARCPLWLWTCPHAGSHRVCALLFPADALTNGNSWGLYYVNATNSANPPLLLDLTAKYTVPDDSTPFGRASPPPTRLPRSSD
jgi:hypothetical protein